MLYFIIPLRSRNASRDFTKVCALLERTLGSICNQTCAEYRVLVMCHEKPHGITEHPQIEYVPVPFDPPPASVLDLPADERLFAMRSDKGRKLIRGLETARRDASEYVMVVDADDLVSKRIARLCEDVAHPNGWVMDRGYRLDETTPWIAYRRRRFNHECGSSYILRTTKALFPEKLDYSADFSDYYIRRYVTHAYVGENMENRGFPLAICPFYGAVYYFNDQAIFSRDCRRREGIARIVLRALIKGRIVTNSFAREFGIIGTPTAKEPKS